MQVLIIADDLTGALDSAVALTGAGLRCVVARRPGDVAAALERRPDVLAVSTASREGGAAAARASVVAALDAVGPLPEILFKKVDSRLKGHVADETAVMAQAAGRRRALVAPAVPAQGRIVEDGCLTGTGVGSPVDVARRVGASALALEAPDTRVDADFDRALSEALSGPPALLVGAAGLAAAVARRLAPGSLAVPKPRLWAPVLLAIGSRDPITQVQVDRLADRGVPVAVAPNGVCPPLTTAGAARALVLTAEDGVAFEAGAADARFASGVARLVGEGAFGTLLGCGGQTADAILGALGHGVLDLVGEIAPGLPVSSLILDGRPLSLVTKSGGFGGPDALAEVVAASVSR